MRDQKRINSMHSLLLMLKETHREKLILSAGGRYRHTPLFRL